MNFQTLAHALDQALPDERLFADLQCCLADYQQGDMYILVFDYTSATRRYKETIAVPVDTAFYTVFKLFANDIIGEPFNAFRARVAIGSVECRVSGLMTAEYAFADILYSVDMQIITFDLMQSVLTGGRYFVKENAE